VREGINTPDKFHTRDWVHAQCPVSGRHLLEPAIDLFLYIIPKNRIIPKHLDSPFWVNLCVCLTASCTKLFGCHFEGLHPSNPNTVQRVWVDRRWLRIYFVADRASPRVLPGA